MPLPHLPPQIASDGLKGRVVEVSLADLQNVSVAEQTSSGAGLGGDGAGSGCQSGGGRLWQEGT